MPGAGLDIGAANTKAAVIDGTRMLSFSSVPSGWDTRASADNALEQALSAIGLSRDALTSIGATGMGRNNIDFSSFTAIDSSCSARGAIQVLPSAGTIIDIGAEQTQVFTCSPEGRVLDYFRNDQCAAGAGAFLEDMASVLGTDVDGLNTLAEQATENIVLDSTCAIFAESEVISLLSEGTRAADIAQAVCNAIASRVYTLVRNIRETGDIALIGGVAGIRAVVSALEKQLGRTIFLPEEPRAVSALGVALMAQELMK